MKKVFSFCFLVTAFFASSAFAQWEGTRPIGSWEKSRVHVLFPDGREQNYVMKTTVTKNDMVDGYPAQFHHIEIIEGDHMGEAFDQYGFDFSESYFFDEARLLDFVAHCPDHDGVLEDVTAENGVTYQTCKFTGRYNGGKTITSWVGPVVDGSVKAIWDLDDGRQAEFSIVDFGWN